MFGFVGVVAAEIHGFAHFGDGVVQRFAGFAHGQRHQLGHVRFHQVGQAAQHGGALGGGNGSPAAFGSFGGGDDFRYGGGLYEGGAAHHFVVVSRIAYFMRALGGSGHGQERHGVQGRGRRAVHNGLQLLQRAFVAQVEALRIEAFVAIQIARQRQAVVGVDTLFGQGVERAADEGVDADVFIHNLVYKRGVRAVFQQAAHQVGQQGFVRAHRRIHAHAPSQVLRADHLVVQGFAHAVQALVFELFAFAHLVNCGQGVGVVGSELREYGILRVEQFACTGQVGNVGVDFAGVGGIAVHAVHLRPFDFAVPIRAFHQSDHQLLIVAAGKVD